MEIERKFLVRSADYRKEAFKNVRMLQGFLNTDPQRTVRVRIAENKGYLTVKGISNDAGTSRKEWEFEIEVQLAEEMIALSEASPIDKTRFLVKSGEHLFEIDEFHGANAGLVVAEVELQTEDEVFTKPHWLGDEVTGDPKYYNAQLSKIPFEKWQY